MPRKRAEQTQATEAAASQELIVSGEPDVTSEPGENDEKPKYTPDPNPRGWAHNNAAGVEFRTRREPYQAELVFADKPPQEVITHIKDQGFRWNGPEKMWTRPVDYSTQAQDRLIASRTYQKVVEMLLEAKGLAAEPERTPF